MGFVVLKDTVELDSGELEVELIALVRSRVGPVACFNRALVAQRLPKTLGKSAQYHAQHCG